MQKKRFIFIALVVAVILCIPYLAMQFTDEVNWNLPDFIIAGLMLFAAGALLDLIFTKVKNTKYRMVLGIALLLFFLLVWAELAVGISGTPFGGN